MASPFTKLAAWIWRLYDTDGVPSSGKHEPEKQEIIQWGTEMENLLGDAPSRVGIQMKFSAETNTAADPGDGYLALNLTSPLEGSTEIALSDVDKFGLPYRNLWLSLDDSTNAAWRATLIVRQADSDFSAVLRVNGPAIAEDGWVRLPIEWVDGAGTFVDGADVGVVPIPTGNEGGNTLAIPIFDPYKPVGGEVMWSAPVPAPMTLLAGLTESFGTCSIVPTAEAVFSLRRAAKGTDPDAAVEFGTATYAAGEREPTFDSADDVEFAAGDVLVVVGPDPQDATLVRPALTLVGHLSV